MKDSGKMIQGSFPAKLALSFLITAFCIGNANANCDVPRMLSVLANLPKPAKKIEVEETKQESTDGGSWTINLDKKAVTQFIVRHLNFESGTVDITFVRFKDGSLATISKNHSFKTYEDVVTQTAYCQDRTILTVMNTTGPAADPYDPYLVDATVGLEAAKNDKKRLFESPEVKAYVDKMKRW
jgi:hypothetical protein